MDDESSLTKALREACARYVLDAQQRPVGYLLTPEEYAEYLEMLEDRADSQDPEIAQRLTQAVETPDEARPTLREYLRRRNPDNASVQD